MTIYIETRGDMSIMPPLQITKTLKHIEEKIMIMLHDDMERDVLITIQYKKWEMSG